MLDRLLDIAKENTIVMLGHNMLGHNWIDIINKGTKQNTSGEWEEYIVKRWIYKDEPRESNKNN